jgi:hypothetical protein
MHSPKLQSCLGTVPGRRLLLSQLFGDKRVKRVAFSQLFSFFDGVGQLVVRCLGQEGHEKTAMLKRDGDDMSISEGTNSQLSALVKSELFCHLNRDSDSEFNQSYAESVRIFITSRKDSFLKKDKPV